MQKGRLEAFSDGMIAIIMTIMVLELRPPHGVALQDLAPLAPALFTYVLSFLFLAIYWGNHHHLLHAAKHIDGWVLWANMHLLLWLSFVPFATAWLGQTRLASVPTAIYAAVQLGASIAYALLTVALVRVNGKGSDFAAALGGDLKGRASMAVYAIATGLAFVSPAASCALLVLVGLMWLVPDRRFAPREVPEVRR